MTILVSDDEMVKYIEATLANDFSDLQNVSYVYDLAGHIRELTAAVQRNQSTKADVLQLIWKITSVFNIVVKETRDSRKNKPTQVAPGQRQKRTRVNANLSPDMMADSMEPACCPALNTIRQQLDRMEEKMNQVDTTINKKLYSSVAANNASGPFIQKPRYEKQITMIIRKDVNGVALSGPTIKQEVLNMKSVQSKVGMQTVYKDKSAIITVRSDSEAELLRSELKSGNYVISEKGTRMPQLKIVGIGSEPVQSDNLLESLLAKNQELGMTKDNTSVVQILKKTRIGSDGKSRLFQDAVIKISHDVASRFQKGGKVYVFDRRCTVYLDDQVVQCYNCRKFGHPSKYCGSNRGKTTEGMPGTSQDATVIPPKLCPNCGESCGQGVACKPQQKKCSNCESENTKRRAHGRSDLLLTTHSSNDFKKCTIARQYKDMIRKQIFGF